MWNSNTTFSGNYNYNANLGTAPVAATKGGKGHLALMALCALGLLCFLLFGNSTAANSVPAIKTQADIQPAAKEAKKQTPKPKPKPKTDDQQPATKEQPPAELPAQSGAIVMTAAPADPNKLVPKNVEAYINQWAAVAIREQRRTGVPASISLAQGIVESHAGYSILAVSAKNHFGLKCHEKHKGKAGHCVNYTDDVDKDFFLNFQNAARSWEYHSNLLSKGRYKKLHGRTWQGWCTGLQECGYATSKTYAKALTSIINRYRLYEYDKGY